jgi:hypothetical protein
VLQPSRRPGGWPTAEPSRRPRSTRSRRGRSAGVLEVAEQPLNPIALEPLGQAPEDARRAADAALEQLGRKGRVDRAGVGVLVQHDGKHRARHLRQRVRERQAGHASREGGPARRRPAFVRCGGSPRLRSAQRSASGSDSLAPQV